MTPDQFQTAALAWLSAISVVSGAVIGLIYKNKDAIKSVVAAVQQLRDRMQVHDDLHNIVPPLQTPLPESQEPNSTKERPTAQRGQPKSQVKASTAVIISISSLVLLPGCGTPTGIATANFLESPVNQKILAAAANAGAASIVASAGTHVSPDQQEALTAAASAVLDAGGTGIVWASGEALRTKQGTSQAASAVALQTAVVDQSGASAATAQPIAHAVQALAASGIPANVANQAVAQTVQAVANQKTP